MNRGFFNAGLLGRLPAKPDYFPVDFAKLIVIEISQTFVRGFSPDPGDLGKTRNHHQKVGRDFAETQAIIGREENNMRHLVADRESESLERGLENPSAKISRDRDILEKPVSEQRHRSRNAGKGRFPGRFAMGASEELARWNVGTEEVRTIGDFVPVEDVSGHHLFFEIADSKRHREIESQLDQTDAFLEISFSK